MPETFGLGRHPGMSAVKDCSDMRIVSFDTASGQHLGVLDGEEVIDLQAVEPRFPADMRMVLADAKLGLQAVAHLAGIAKAEHRRPRNELALALPVRTPGKIICLGLNYHDHAKEGGNTVAAWPAIFLRTLNSLVASGQPIVQPLVSDKLDYEAELVAVIGARTRHATLGTALDAIAGYSCFNDGSVRDYQRHTTQWTLGKNFDATGGFGPVFVTADELLPGARGLKIETRLNGKVMQRDNTDNMVFPVAETVVIVSKAMTLDPGDLLVMGTPAGVGYARKPPVFMQDGDICEIEIDKIGVLRNPIQKERPA